MCHRYYAKGSLWFPQIAKRVQTLFLFRCDEVIERF